MSDLNSKNFNKLGQVFKSSKEVSSTSPSSRSGYKSTLKQLFLKISASFATELQEMRQDFHFWIYQSQQYFLNQKFLFQNSLSWLLIHAFPLLFITLVISVAFLLLLFILLLLLLSLSCFFSPPKKPSRWEKPIKSK